MAVCNCLYLATKNIADDSVDGVPLNDDSDSYDSSDSEDIDTVGSSEPTKTAANDKSIPVTDCNKKSEAKVSGFSMTFSSSVKPSSSTAQPSAAVASSCNTKQDAPVINAKSAAEIGAIKMKIGLQVSCCCKLCHVEYLTA